MIAALVFCLLLFFNDGNAGRCGGANRKSCQNVYTARRCSVLDECIQLWRSSIWEKYANDTSSKCTVCRNLGKTLPISKLDSMCKLTSAGNEIECQSALSELTGKLRLDSSKPLQDQRDVDILCNTLSFCETDLYLGGLDFGSVLCDDCKKFVENIRLMVADNATTEAIITELNGIVCENLPEHVRDYCKKTVEVHVPVVMHLIEIHISPEDICALLRLCPKSPEMSVTLEQLFPRQMQKQLSLGSPANLRLCSGRISYSWINRPTNRRNYYMFTSHSPVNFAVTVSSPSCEECMAVVQKMKDSVNDPAFQEEIKQGLEKEVCASLGYLRVICEKAVQGHFDEIINDIKKLDIRKTCSVFKMCVPTAASSVAIQTQLQPSFEIPVVCQLCEVIVEKVLDIVVDKPTEASITAALDQVCQLVPIVYKKRCDNFMENFGAQIVEAIIKGTAPKLACTSVGLCTGPFMNTLVRPSVPTLPSGSSYCGTCKVLVNLAYKQLLRNDTEEELKAVAKSVCSILPGSYASECDSLVDEYLSLVIQYLTEDLTPEEVCEKIGFCPEAAGINQAICLRGPAYWCINRETAERCNATAICTTQRLDGLRTFGPSNRRNCAGRNRAEICGSLEWAAACGLTRECLEDRIMNYVQTMTHVVGMTPLAQSTTSTVLMNCTICGQLVKRWSLQRKFLGSPFLSNEPCFVYTNEEDRKQCNLVASKRYSLLREVMRTNTDPENVCKMMNLCQKQPSRAMNSACLQDPLYALSSRRAAELCGTLDIYNEIEQISENHGTSTASTVVPPSVSPFPIRYDLPDSVACVWGPSFWCLSLDNAQRCGQKALDHCRTTVWRASQPADRNIRYKPLVGNIRCTWGPSYWCSRLSNAQSCGSHAVDYCRRMGSFV